MAQFKIGQKVNAIGFTDCFGKVHAVAANLTVEKVTEIKSNSIPTYWRVLAAEGYHQVEGAERFFEAV